MNSDSEHEWGDGEVDDAYLDEQWERHVAASVTFWERQFQALDARARRRVVLRRIRVAAVIAGIVCASMMVGAIAAWGSIR